MFEGFQQRNGRRWTLAAIIIGALLVIVKICLHVIDLEHHESYATTDQPAPPAPPVPVADPWHRTALPGFSLEAREPLSPVGNYAQGHAELHSYVINWRIRARRQSRARRRASRDWR